MDEEAAARMADPEGAAAALEDGEDLPRWARLVARGEAWRERLSAIKLESDFFAD